MRCGVGGGSASISTVLKNAMMKSEEHDVVALAARLSSQEMERWNRASELGALFAKTEALKNHRVIKNKP